MIGIGTVITYEGRIWDLDAKAWDTIDRGANGDQPRARFEVVSICRNVPGIADHVSVVSADYPRERSCRYLIFDLDGIQT